jgi:hypothetical protein
LGQVDQAELLGQIQHLVLLQPLWAVDMVLLRLLLDQVALVVAVQILILLEALGQVVKAMLAAQALITEVAVVEEQVLLVLMQ